MKKHVEEIKKILYWHVGAVNSTDADFERCAKDLATRYRKQSERESEWYVDDFTKVIKCKYCTNDAPICTVSGEQYEAQYCPSCGAKMKGATYEKAET